MRRIERPQFKRRRRAGEDDDLGEPGRLQLTGQRRHGVGRRLAADQHGIGRRRRNRSKRDVRLGACVDHEMIVALLERPERAPKHLRLQQTIRMVADLPPC